MLKKIEDLIEKAKKLKERGLSTGEIADELNVSEETALWLLTTAKKDISPPSDIYIDWSTISVPIRLRNLALIMADIIQNVTDYIETVVGIAASGIPIATMVAEELEAELAIYYPRKLKSRTGSAKSAGFISENFAKVSGKKCVIVDDIISTGATLAETVDFLKKNDSNIICATVIIDKKGFNQINGVSVFSLLKVIRL